MKNNKMLLRGIWVTQLAILGLAAFSIANTDAESYRYAFNVYLAYLILVTVLSWRDRQQADRLSDDAYFTGYVLTILGLIGIAARFGREADPLAEPARIVEAGSTSLGATILGLLVRSLIRNLIPLTKVDPLGEHSTSNPTITIDYGDFFAQLTRCNDRLLKDLERIRLLNIDEVQQSISKCSQSIAELDIKTHTATGTLVTVITHLKQIEVGLKASTATMEAGGETLEEIAGAARVVGAFGESAMAAKCSADGISEALQNADKRARAFVATVDELTGVLANFTNIKAEEFKRFTPMK